MHVVHLTTRMTRPSQSWSYGIGGTPSIFNARAPHVIRARAYARASRVRAREGAIFLRHSSISFFDKYIKKGVIRKWSFWPLLDAPLSDTHKSCRWVVDQLLIKNWSKTDHFWIWSICHVFDHFFNQLLYMSFRWFVHVAYMLRCGKVVILTCASDVSFWHMFLIWHAYAVSDDLCTVHRMALMTSGHSDTYMHTTVWCASDHQNDPSITVLVVWYRGTLVYLLRARDALYARARTRARHGCARARGCIFFTSQQYIFFEWLYIKWVSPESGHFDHFWTPLWGVFWAIHTSPVDE